MLSPVRHNKVPNSPSCYLFPSSATEDFLKEYHDETKECPLKVLILSSGDLPFSLPAKSLFSDTQVESITVTNDSALIIARNILFATVISDENFNPKKENHVEYLWNIWYNMEWSLESQKRFLENLRKLLEGKISPNLKIPLASDMDLVRKIWGFWETFLSEMDATIMQRIHNQRYETIINHIHGILFPQTPWQNSHLKPKLSEVWEWMIAQTKDHLDVSHLPAYHSKAMSEEMKIYFETGNCCKTKENKFCVNPMLIEPKSGNWALAPSVSPFELYLNLKNLPQQNDFLDSCKKAFGEQVENLQKWLKNAQLLFFIGDPLDLCYRRTWMHPFDIVDCSNLPDSFGLANIINGASLVLSDKSSAVLLTQSSPWRNGNNSVVRYTSTKEFIEESLCTSIQLIPSLYGLILLNHVRLGNPLPLKKNWRASIHLQWKKASSFQNMFIEISGAIGDCFENLQSICFRETNDQNYSHQISEAFTPLTYCYIASSFGARNQLSDSAKQSLEQFSLPSSMQLFWKTLMAWRSGSKVLQFRVQLTPICNENGNLRLVLACNETNVNYIDNFALSRDDAHLIVSFMLLEDHGLDLTSTSVYLTKDGTQTPLTSTCFLNENYLFLDYPIPFIPIESTSPLLSCLEFEDFYHIALPEVQQEDLKLSTERQHPSEAGHQITLSTEMFSHVLSFPWPFNIAEVHSTCDPETSFVRLILPKSIYEPQPFEWRQGSKWDISKLNPWDEKNLLRDLNFHLSTQFDFRDLKRQMLNEVEIETPDSSLKGVREIIRTLFQSTTNDGNELYVIRSKHDPKLKNLWYLRIHLPIRVSPLGSPMLLLTANDHRLAQKLVDRGKLEQTQATEDFKRIFVEGATSPNVCPLFVQSDEEEAMLRYLLRVNAAKISPNIWPIEQVPKDENSPWLNTFVSPCYVDQTGTNAEMEDLVATTNKIMIKAQGNELTTTGTLEDEILPACSKCKQLKKNLKRCSRCKSVKYCSIECQRSDWANHKSSCI